MFGMFKAHEAGELRELFGRIGQAMGLVIFHHLQAMFDRAIKTIRLNQFIARGLRKLTGFG